MYQLTFSEQSLFEIKKMDPEAQIHFVEKLSNLTEKDLKNESVNTFDRDGKKYHRLKVEEYRVYLECVTENTFSCQYILPQHSFEDFLFRTKMPVTDDQMIDKNTSFWKYLESLRK